MVYPPWNTPFDQWASDPDAQSYAEDLLFYAAPLVLVAALLLPLIVCITLCCRKRCCGASKPASRIGPAACSTARSATTCVASRRVAAAYGVAHLALRTPFYVQNHDARSASTAVSRPWTRYARGNIGAQG